MQSKITSDVDLFDTAFLERLERMTLQARRFLRGGLGGEHLSRRRLPAPTFSDHRPYAPGDDLRHVDWFAYARHDDLHLKLGETEQDINVTIALDCSRSLDWGRGELHKGRYALQLAAMLGYIALSSNDRLQMWSFADRLHKPFGPAVSRTRGPELLRYLRQTRWHGTTSLDAVTQQVKRQRGGMLVVISDLWNGGNLDELLRTAIAPAWHVVVLHVLHPEEIKPTLDGAIELEDSESGALIALNIDDQARDDYRKRLIAWIKAIEQTCRDRGATYAGIRTDRPLEQNVLPFLRRRAIIG